jgi:hypothetical protein
VVHPIVCDRTIDPAIGHAIDHAIDNDVLRHHLIVSARPSGFGS